MPTTEMIGSFAPVDGTTTAQMRRTTLAHGVLSFFFNIAVLAMSINVIGGVI